MGQVIRILLDLGQGAWDSNHKIEQEVNAWIVSV